MKSGRVAIVGWGVEPYSGSSRYSSEEMGFRVVKMARNKGKIPREAITSVHNSTMDLFDGVTISNGILLPAAGGYNRDGVRIQNGGAFALISACASILADCSEVAVVSSADANAYDMANVVHCSGNLFFEQPLGYSRNISYALFATAWADKHGVNGKSAVRAAARNYRDGAGNELAHVRDGFDEQAVGSSTLFASPLHEKEVALQSSFGGAGLILTSEERAREFTDNPVYIAGWGMATDSEILENCFELPAIRKAAKRAYGIAGIKDPAKELAVAEIASPFSVFELAACEALGFCAAADSAKFLDAGPLTVNPSGGVLCTNAMNSGGLFRAAQAAAALDAGAEPNRALVHDSDICLGVAGASHAVLILERGR